jgi:FkbM family methyltransferase
MSVMQSVRERVKAHPVGLKLTRFAGNFYFDPDRTWIPSNLDACIEVDGLRYHVNSQVNSIMRLRNDWRWFDGLRKTDVVLDLGASIGGAALPMASMVKHVYAVEPLWHQELRRNITLNGFENVTVMPCAIGTQKTGTIEFGEYKAECPMTTLPQLLKTLPSLDVIKIDIEGYEWTFHPTLLYGIREIRIEFHIRKRTNDWQCYQDWLFWFDHAGYKWEVVADNRNLSIWVPFKANLAVRATRRDQ